MTDPDRRNASLDLGAEELGSLLAGVTEPAPVLSGRLHADGPWVRIAPVRGRLVAITDAPAASVAGLATDWLAEHPLSPQAATQARCDLHLVRSTW